MKKIKFLLPLVASILMFTGCESFLDTELSSDTIVEEEALNLEGYIDMHVKGMYTQMYDVTSSQDQFGQKSVDLVTDMMSSDIALTGVGYGWFASVAQLQNSQSGGPFTGYFWRMYYRIVKNANLSIKALQKTEVVTKDYLNNPPATLTTEEKTLLNDYAQALTMRGFAYFQLMNLYTYPVSNLSDIPRANSVMLYDENSSELEAKDRSSQEEVMLFIEKDLKLAKQYFDAASVTREAKIFVNKDIANAYLAYTYLQWGKYAEAYNTSKEVIDAANYQIMPYEDLLTTGFVDVNDRSWMWGLDQTVETNGGIINFWVHVDIHTYGYAAIGDKKVIDANLFKEIPKTDKRREWFNLKFSKAPDGKFFDLDRGLFPNVDRDWVNDLVYMRIEEMYLIAAEAAARADAADVPNNIVESQKYLKLLLDERDPTEAANVAALNKDQLLAALSLNWRVELWGEGRALMTMKRFKETHARGDNHIRLGGTGVAYSDPRLTFAIPYAEGNSNPNLKK